MPTLISDGSPTRCISDAELEAHVAAYLDKLGPAKRILVIPPDHTRGNSRAGQISQIIWKLRSSQADIWFMPALGTHVPMNEGELRWFFGPDIPLERFLPHRWRTDLVELGAIPQNEMEAISEGLIKQEMKVAVNRELYAGYDLILSVGQVVPHEVVGLANYTKNILIGVGGAGTIHVSHFLGAAWGMERMMGRLDTPVRKCLNTGFDRFLRGKLPIHYLLTVVSKDKADNQLKLRGLYCGDDDATFEAAGRLSQRVNLDLLDKPIQKAVVFLDPHEFKTTWLGNKSVYRTRMAMATGGELLVLAPALHMFGEDPEIDKLIRRHGYRGTPATMKAVETDPEMAKNLSAAAHLIHGSSEGRFKITYACGPDITREEVEGVGFAWQDYAETIKRYNPETLADGWTTLPDGEEIFFVSNPALGLWAPKAAFE